MTLSLIAQDKAAYVLYDAKGKKASYQKMIKALEKADILLFGEEHNNPIAHWLQLEVIQDMANNRQLSLGAEMIEADDQEHLNQYLSGQLTYEQLDSAARLWTNYKTDYAPLVDFAKEQDLSFTATNVPRRYANQVYRGGFSALDSLSDTERQWIAPLPIVFDSTLMTYQAILEMMGDHGTPLLVKAQALKDATMAHFISENYLAGNLFVHFNGSYHSDHGEGILWYLKQLQPNLTFLTITTVSQSDIYKLEKEHKGKADYIICVDEDMTSTY